MKKLVTLTLLFSVLATFAWSHSGRTDKRGCHVDSRTGIEHCH